MLYSFNNPCWNCKKSKFEVDGEKIENRCLDEEKIRDAIHKIHTDNDGSHQGSGEVLLMCSKVGPLIK